MFPELKVAPLQQNQEGNVYSLLAYPITSSLVFHARLQQVPGIYCCGGTRQHAPSKCCLRLFSSFCLKLFPFQSESLNTLFLKLGRCSVCWSKKCVEKNASLLSSKRIEAILNGLCSDLEYRANRQKVLLLCFILPYCVFKEGGCLCHSVLGMSYTHKLEMH